MNDALLALDPSARTLRSGGLRAVFLPGRGMLGASPQHRGEELLGRVEDMASFAQSSRTCGIPLLHPWANRLGAMRYRAAGKEVLLDTGNLDRPRRQRLADARRTLAASRVAGAG
jgi:galactose mutarotase-like enzyme